MMRAPDVPGKDSEEDGSMVAHDKKSIWGPVALLCLAAMSLATVVSGCSVFGLEGTRGSGNLKTETRAVSGFTRVELSGVGTLNIAQTGTESLAISAEDNLLPLLTSTVSDGTLTLRVRQGDSISPTKPIVYTLSVKHLDGVQLSGAGAINAVDITTNALDVSLSGAGSMVITGSAQSQTASISGAGRYDAKGFQTAATQVTISGEGNMTVSASQTLNATVSGSGAVTYYGSPQVAQKISGSGTVKQGR